MNTADTPAAGWRDRLRREVLQDARDDGGLDLLDPLRDRLHRLSRRDVRALDRGNALLVERLERELLFDGPEADALRDGAFARHTERAAPAAAPAPTIPSGPTVDWARAEALPAAVAAPWRAPEPWRRLAEDHAAGRRYLTLRGFLAADAVDALAHGARALPYDRLATELVHADRRLLADDELPAWRALLADAHVRALFGAVLGRALPPGLVANAWRLGRGDHMGVHPDGTRYRGTISVGLNRDWTAADGGAIAFGDPRPGGLHVRERWLPHAGDVCVFAPEGDTWHAVEPVTGARDRWTVTAWWVEPEHSL